MGNAWPPAGTRSLPVDVVSIQSQVVYGRVGNNVALPTLATLGMIVAAVPTVILSNTPHYPTLHGGPVPDDWFAGWLDDLTLRGGLRRLRAVVTGYLGSAGQATAVSAWLGQRLAKRPGLRVVVDPVVGDHDQGVYVDPGMVTAYRAELLPLADVLTPNDFELAQLTGRTIDDLDATVAAARSLLAGRTRWVAVTSAAPGSWPRGGMRLILVGRKEAFEILHPRIDIQPKGTGDLFTAYLAGAWLRDATVPDAAVRACAAVIDALRMTRDARCAELLLPAAADNASPGEVSIREL